MMCATTGRLAGRRRQRRRSITRATAAANIRRGIWPAMAGSSRPTPMPGTPYSMTREPGPLVAAAYWVHARRPYFAIADVASAARRKAEGKTTSVVSPLALGRAPQHRKVSAAH